MLIFFQLTASIQDTMTETLVENYGVELHDDFNRAVTKAWDKAQEKVYTMKMPRGWCISYIQ